MPELILSPRVVCFALPLLSALACVDEPGGQDDEGGSESTGQIDTGDTDTFTGDTDTASDTGTDTATDTGGECLTPVPDDPNIALSFDLWGDLELVPGASWHFEVGQIECCVFWEPLETCSVYSVSPEGAGATIDPDSGLLSIDPDTADSTVFTVTADVEDGRFFVTTDVFVYVPELHPLKGYWRETGRFPCDAGPEFVPDDPINELVFTASGETRVT
ncbi:MAG: hypothetical protein KC431_14035, partial [Myxococcales bacterium]|nr:hypothetical protein [Myxococcales bacterium]